MPPPPSLPHEDLQKRIFAADDVVDSTGEVAAPSHAVWRNLSEEIGIPKITPKYLHTYVVGNRWDCYDNLLLHHRIPNPQNTALTTCVSTSADSDDSSLSSPKSVTSEGSVEDAVIKPKRTFSVLIPAAMWAEMTPILQNIKCKKRGVRKRLRLPSDSCYTNKLRRQLWTQHRLPCPYSVKTSYVSKSYSRRAFVKIEALCNECGSEATGTIASEPQEGEDVIMLWRTNDSRGVPHQKRQRLQGEERKRVGIKLQHDSCERYKREVASENMDPGDTLPPFLYTNDVLRHARAQQIDAKLRIVKGKDVIQSLVNLKHKEPYAGSLHDIGADKFCLHYYTPLQLELYKQYRGRTYTSISIDATGSLVESIPRPTGHSGAIFLYEIVLHTGKTQLPVAQMLSEKQDANTILHFLNEWERCGASAPNEVVTDDSPALKSALARSFCRGRSFGEIRDKCMAVLMGTSDDLPPCYLRLDSAHFLKNVKEWKCWKEESLRRLKQFYLYCIGLLMKAKSLQEFEVLLRQILLLALSPFGGCSADGTNAPAEDSLKLLADKIKCSSVSEDFDLDKEDEESIPQLPDVGTKDKGAGSLVRRWLDKVWTEVNAEVHSSDGDRLNPYHSNAIAKNFMDACLDFPHWTAVLLRHYKSPYLTASSAPVESDFKVLKKDILKGITSPLRADRFFAMHFQAIEGQCLISQGTKNADGIVRAGDVRAIATQGCVNEREKYCDEGTKLHDLNANVTKLLTGDEASDRRPMEPDCEQKYLPEELLVKDEMSPETAKKRNPKKTQEHTQSPTTYEDSMSDEGSSISPDPEEAPNDLNNIENWKNKARSQRGRRPKKSTYLDSNANLHVAIHSGQTHAPKQRLLQNGNIVRKPVAMNRTTRVIVTNTCPVDSLVQVLAASYADNAGFRNIMDHSEQLLHKTIKLLAVKGAEPDTYKSRAEMIVSFIDPKGTLPKPPSRSTRNKRDSLITMSYDCFGNAALIAGKIMKDSPSVSFEYTCTSPECSWKTVEDHGCVEVNMNFLLKKGMTALEEAVTKFVERTDRKPKICKECGFATTINLTIGSILLVNVDFLADQQTKGILKENLHNRQYKLEELTQTLKLGQEERKFAGVVAHETAHYVGYAKRHDGFWELYNDLKKNVEKTRSDWLVNPHVLIYTV